MWPFTIGNYDSFLCQLYGLFRLILIWKIQTASLIVPSCGHNGTCTQEWMFLNGYIDSHSDYFTLSCVSQTFFLYYIHLTCLKVLLRVSVTSTYHPLYSQKTYSLFITYHPSGVLFYHDVIVVHSHLTNRSLSNWIIWGLYVNVPRVCK